MSDPKPYIEFARDLFSSIIKRMVPVLGLIKFKFTDGIFRCMKHAAVKPYFRAAQPTDQNSPPWRCLQMLSCEHDLRRKSHKKLTRGCIGSKYDRKPHSAPYFSYFCWEIISLCSRKYSNRPRDRWIDISLLRWHAEHVKSSICSSPSS